MIRLTLLALFLAAPAFAQAPGSDWRKPSDRELRSQLSALEYRVTQEDATERAGTSPLDDNDRAGIYVDVVSGEALFSSRDKFDSGTGWPSFVRPIDADAVTEHRDMSLGSLRIEIRSALADSHLGHVFGDGPRNRGGLRYCMNGAAMRFVPAADLRRLGYGEYADAFGQ
ncbi:peptide-methionine (R)-S-oxide reductase MsrB [Rubrivirga sp.]|uniref:peptide-methionine (R)-S-oxide reductase MsrB n=1 Tax=Rubrivirga sp. TaxID=1885344 RepID=UPI003C7773F3